MMELLPIGSVVTINNDENKTKLMIISVFPLKNENGKVGYYDYASCLYPYGLVNDQIFFFNREDINEVLSKGFNDEEALEFSKKLVESEKNIDYPHLYNEKYTKQKEDLSDLLKD